MNDKFRIGIIICDRYSKCAGGKCFRALNDRAGAFGIYNEKNVELVGYTSCGGCPGGNIEYAPEEMVKNGAQVIHFATGFLVGYPPCPFIRELKSVVEEKFGLEIILGTHPIPQKYYLMHKKLSTWNTAWWKEAVSAALADTNTRLAYD